MKIKAILIITILNLLVLMVISANILTEVRAEKMEKAEALTAKQYQAEKIIDVNSLFDSLFRASLNKTDSIITAQLIKEIKDSLEVRGVRIDGISVTKTKK